MNTWIRSVALAGAMIWSSAVFAAGIICSNDARPMDGSYSEMKLVDTGSGYEVWSKVITSGFGSPVKTIEEKLAAGLTCTISGVVADCFRQGVGDEEQNSWASFVTVDKTRIVSGELRKDDTVVEIEVGSPLVPKREGSQVRRLSYKLASRYGSCRPL